ncbi:MAG: hypothetical protein RBS88_07805 [Spongiibacteraceae bacterium]|jgi:hypothetical protein|nr:hypothetical protein [Spongiibacteraceae bacterium]
MTTINLSQLAINRIFESAHVVYREIGGGVWRQDAAGRSHGHVFVCAERQRPRAIFPGDCIPHPLQLVRSLPLFADHDPSAAIIMRQQLLAGWTDTVTALIPAHFRGAAGAGQVCRHGDGYPYPSLRT